MSARRDINITRGDDYTHVVVFNADQSAYTFDASAGPLSVAGQVAYSADVVAFVPTVSGASVSLALNDSQTAALSAASVTWKLRRTAGTDTHTILKGNVLCD